MATRAFMVVGLVAMMLGGATACKGRSRVRSRCEKVAERMSALTMKTQLSAARKRRVSKDRLARLKKDIDKSLHEERAASTEQCMKLAKREPARASKWIDCILAARTQLAMGKCAAIIARR